MSGAPTGKSEWLVLIPDHEGVLKKRMEVRPYVLLEPPCLRLGRSVADAESRLHFAALDQPMQKEAWSMGGELFYVLLFE
jgi:hypothetical protein